MANSQNEPAVEEDDIFAALGHDAGPITSNDLFWDYITTGSHKKIENLRYWLMHEMSRYHDFHAKNVRFTKYIIKDGVAKHSALSPMEYAKLSIDYYLNMSHLPWFNGANGKEPCDREVIIGKIVTYECVRNTIEKSD